MHWEFEDRVDRKTNRGAGLKVPLNCWWWWIKVQEDTLLFLGGVDTINTINT
jgi:hypothetical protein